jgi:GDPmannose 4,6-dehydratase
MRRTALVTGIAGQDGSYLAELLISNGYAVTGTVLDTVTARSRLPASVRDLVVLVQAGDNSQDWYDNLIRQVRPDEIYNLAGMSFVPDSARDPAVAAEAIAMSAIRLFQAVRRHHPSARVYQACSSEMFGTRGSFPQNEETPLAPSSPYGAAKTYTLFAADQYRELFGTYVVAGICFNHESPRRPETFVSRRISLAAARIKAGQQRVLSLGALDAVRDWGFAGDYVVAMWKMLQQTDPRNYVIATGVLHSVQQMVEVAFDEAGLKWQEHVAIDPVLVRPAESRPLVGDPRQARERLDWQATTDFESLVRMMVRADMAHVA